MRRHRIKTLVCERVARHGQVQPHSPRPAPAPFVCGELIVLNRTLRAQGNGMLMSKLRATLTPFVEVGGDVDDEVHFDDCVNLELMLPVPSSPYFLRQGIGGSRIAVGASGSPRSADSAAFPPFFAR